MRSTTTITTANIVLILLLSLLLALSWGTPPALAWSLVLNSCRPPGVLGDLQSAAEMPWPNLERFYDGLGMLFSVGLGFRV